MRALIKHLHHEKSSHKIGDHVLVMGWVRTLRDQKKFAFIEINDGSCLANIQVIANSDLENFSEILEKVATGASLKVNGVLVESPGKGQKVEIHAKQIEIVGQCDSSYPLQKKRHSFEFLRSIAHLRPRTNSLGAIARIRNALAMSTHRFFQERDFLYVNTPIITASDCEGAGELFQVTSLKEGASKNERGQTDYSEDFFEKPVFLTPSGQLNAEAYALSHSNVYTFGPTFRAENSNTSRHLAEFWMVEPEMAFADLQDSTKLAEAYLKFVLSDLLDKHLKDLELFNSFIAKGLVEKLEHVIKNPFEKISYTEAVQILEKSSKKFEFPVHWGIDLQSEHERYLTEEHFKKPLMVTDYPKDIKAFYMRNNEDGKTCAAVDVLVPQMGEIIGGAQREERFDILKQKMTASKLNLETYDWYLDLRRFGGAPHAGFGLGFERLIQYATGMENIRDVIPFPRSPKHADF
ncbi:MAG: Asparagine--tRNA ligase [Chlamydiae bacterium]|nr:Asparagine--tRNA ligase [Chlamydiota bacterium]